MLQTHLCSKIDNNKKSYRRKQPNRLQYFWGDNLKDIPFFSTELGVASLTLREIPYSKRAYILIRDTQEGEAFLRECAGFCCVAGAEEIYASGHTACQAYPEHTAILQMQIHKEQLEESDAYLFPVTEASVGLWRQLYNEKAVNIPNAAYMTAADEKELIRSCGGYFIHKDGSLLGIGRVEGNMILWISSCIPGQGKTVLCALAHTLTDEIITLEVSEKNTKAMAFYERMGFVPSKKLSCWYRIK